MPQKVIISAFALIFDSNNKVLLAHRRDHDLWNLPGGGIEKGEAPWDAVTRGVKEETGLEVEIIKLVGVYAKPEQNEIVFAFECKIRGGALTATEEADELRYFSINEIPNNTSPKQIQRIKDALTGQTPHLRIQKGDSSITLLRKGKL